MGGGSSVQQKHLPVEGLDAQPSMYGALSEYLGDLKGAGLNNTEVFDALKRKEEHIRVLERKKRLSTLQSGSIKVLALNQLSINLKSHDEFKIGFRSEKISKQLKSAKETVSGLHTVKSHIKDSQLRSKLSGKIFSPDTFDEKIKEAETQIKFLTHAQNDLQAEMDNIKRQSEKVSSRLNKKSVKLAVEDRPPRGAAPYVPMRNKPKLNVRVGSMEALVAEEVATEVCPKKPPMLQESSEALGGSGHFVSSSGKVRLGDFTIGEQGLHTLSTMIIGEEGKLKQSGGFIDFLEICMLGCGASATVKEAIHVPSFTLVALKMMPIYNQEKRRNVGRELAILYKNLAELSLVDESLDLVPNSSEHGSEITRTSSLDLSKGAPHKSNYVLAMYDAFANPKSGLINLVVEYMDGGSLADLVQNGGCQDEAVLADIATQVLKGLYFLHSKMQMHRDVKPGNILLNSRGQVKIADFGISKALSSTVGFANSFVGTVTYMSPERITSASYTYSSDIWSFGLTLLAVCWGRYPLDNAEGGYWGLLKSIADDDPPTPGATFSEELSSLVDACLRKAPEDRFSALQLLKHPFITSNASNSINKVRNIQKTRRSSEGQLALGKALKGVNLGSPKASSPKPIDRRMTSFNIEINEGDDEDVKVSHLHRILDQLQSRAIELEESAIEGQVSGLAENIMTIRGSRFFHKINEDESGDGKSGEDQDVIPPSQLSRSSSIGLSIMLPALKGDGLNRWRHLAVQLQLPLDVVLLAAKQRISERFLR